MKICILLASEYPYLRGEAFLENEIGYLSEAFDEIWCFSSNPSRSDIQTRKIPNCVKAYPLHGLKSKLRYPIYLLNGLFGRNNGFIIHEKKLKRVLLCFYSRGRAKKIAHDIIKIINSKDICINDEFIIYSYWFNYLAQAAVIISDYLKKNKFYTKCVSRAHGYDVYWERNSVNYLPFQEDTIKRIDGVYPCSDNGTNYLKALYPNSGGKIITSRLGTIDRGIKEYKYNNTIVFATCCFLNPIKRIPMFASFFAKLCKINSNCKWVCIGDGDDLEIVKQIVLKNKISDKVEFLGARDNDWILNYYKNNDITYFCNVSETEGLPVSIMEALSFGIPVIATDVGGISELIDSSVGELLPKDLDDDILLSFVNRELLISKDKYLNKRLEARNRWEKMTSASQNYKKWIDVLCDPVEEELN